MVGNKSLPVILLHIEENWLGARLPAGNKCPFLFPLFRDKSWIDATSVKGIRHSSWRKREEGSGSLHPAAGPRGKSRPDAPWQVCLCTFIHSTQRQTLWPAKKITACAKRGAWQPQRVVRDSATWVWALARAHTGCMMLGKILIFMSLSPYM